MAVRQALESWRCVAERQGLTDFFFLYLFSRICLTSSLPRLYLLFPFELTCISHHIFRCVRSKFIRCSCRRVMQDGVERKPSRGWLVDVFALRGG